MLDGIAQVPWFVIFADSLRKAVESESATDKQVSFITKLYTDACFISEEAIKEQKIIRRFLNSLIVAGPILDSRTMNFVVSVYNNTAQRKLSSRQMKAVENIYALHRNAVQDYLKKDNLPDYSGWMINYDKK